MTIHTFISFKQYVKLIYRLTYGKPFMKIIVGAGLLIASWVIGWYAGINLPKPAYYHYVTLSLIFVAQPALIYMTIRRSYRSSNHLQEHLEIVFIADLIKIKGESFYMELNWNNMYKITELKKWFLIYQNTLSAILLPKESFKKNTPDEFRSLAKSFKGPVIKLKE